MAENKKTKLGNPSLTKNPNPNPTSEEGENPTDVILVVKGAGNQPPDKHLNLFIKGFWPAITALDGNATISQKIQERNSLDPSPHEKDQHDHITEIKASDRGGAKRVIWVKESYWEPEIIPANPFASLLNEWRMASFTLANLIQDIFFSRNTQKLKVSRKQDGESAPSPELRDKFGNYITYVIVYILAFLPYAIMVEWLDSPLASNYFNLRLQFSILIILSLVLAIPIALEIKFLISNYRGNKEAYLEALPGLPGWMIFVKIILLILYPKIFFIWLLILLGLLVTLLISRYIFWGSRKDFYSDAGSVDYYYLYKKDIKNNKIDGIGQVDLPGWKRFHLSPILYRYSIFFGLPIVFILWILAIFLKWTRIFGGIGDSIIGVLNLLLGGYLTDVVAYAMDTEQAQRIRSVIENDIVFFLGKNKTETNSTPLKIHIFAHSQGTPITYETLYHHLDDQFRSNIHTYITIGSVLNYYNQARGMLDPIYYERFPVPQEKEESLSFHDEFMWINFWNFTDMITEFFGLDAYIRYERILNTNNIRPLRTSPRNFRSRSSPKNHAEYWTNLEEINLPFAKRLLGYAINGVPDEWKTEVGWKTFEAENISDKQDEKSNDEIKHKNKTPEENPSGWKDNPWHWLKVFLGWAFLTILIYGGAWLIINGLFLSDINELIDKIIEGAESAFVEYRAQFPPAEDTIGGGVRGLYRVIVSDNVRLFATKILNSILYAIGIIAAIDWFLQIFRANKVRLKKD
ncbi:MAG: hypothetical protein FVQ83_02540 [Chloroflexi bacterium]|nr:hypothetical protein [Chloroflexota bacterium]